MNHSIILCGRENLDCEKSNLFITVRLDDRRNRSNHNRLQRSGRAFSTSHIQAAQASKLHKHLNTPVQQHCELMLEVMRERI